MSDLRAAVEGLATVGHHVDIDDVLALVPEGAVLVVPEDHTPTGYEGMDGYGYVSCSCGWDSSNTTGLGWARHLREGPS